MRIAKELGRRVLGSAIAKVAIVTALLAPIASADVHEVRVPLRDGKLSLPELSAALSTELGLPAIEFGSASIDVQGLGKTLFVSAVNQSLGDGCFIAVDQDAVHMWVDPAKLPHSIDQAKHAAEVFTATEAPDATAKQAAMYGLLLPTSVKPNQPVVVLLHGVDCTRDCLKPLADLLNGEGYQVGFFGYPDDQPIADSAKLFTEHLAAFHETFPNTPIDVVAFSMGGLVARSTIEGVSYPGGVDRLILLAPPNHGSGWAPARFVLEAREQWHLWRTNADYSPSWMITDGLGEAGRDLSPDSKFLRKLNDLPRRDGVKYTIINGNVHPIWKLAGSTAEKAVSVMGSKVSGWIKADEFADTLRDHHADSDGPVSQASTQLDGVTDVVTVAGDHNDLYQPHDGEPPAAWETIRDRLKQ